MDHREFPVDKLELEQTKIKEVEATKRKEIEEKEKTKREAIHNRDTAGYVLPKLYAAAVLFAAIMVVYSIGAEYVTRRYVEQCVESVEVVSVSGGYIKKECKNGGQVEAHPTKDSDKIMIKCKCVNQSVTLPTEKIE